MPKLRPKSYHRSRKLPVHLEKLSSIRGQELPPLRNLADKLMPPRLKRPMHRIQKPFRRLEKWLRRRRGTNLQIHKYLETDLQK